MIIECENCGDNTNKDDDDDDEAFFLKFTN